MSGSRRVKAVPIMQQGKKAKLSGSARLVAHDSAGQVATNPAGNETSVKLRMCLDCGIGNFADLRSLMQHKEVCSKSIAAFLYCCYDCNSGFYSLKDLKNHYRLKHGYVEDGGELLETQSSSLCSTNAVQSRVQRAELNRSKGGASARQLKNRRLARIREKRKLALLKQRRVMLGTDEGINMDVLKQRGMKNSCKFTTTCAIDAADFPHACDSCKVVKFKTLRDQRLHEEWCGSSARDAVNALECRKCSKKFHSNIVLSKHQAKCSARSDGADQLASKNPFDFTTIYAPDYRSFPIFCSSCHIVSFKSVLQAWCHEEWCGLVLTAQNSFRCASCGLYFRNRLVLNKHQLDCDVKRMAAGIAKPSSCLSLRDAIIAESHAALGPCDIKYEVEAPVNRSSSIRRQQTRVKPGLISSNKVHTGAASNVVSAINNAENMKYVANKPSESFAQAGSHLSNVLSVPRNTCGINRSKAVCGYSTRQTLKPKLRSSQVTKRILKKRDARLVVCLPASRKYREASSDRSRTEALRSQGYELSEAAGENDLPSTLNKSSVMSEQSVDCTESWPVETNESSSVSSAVRKSSRTAVPCKRSLDDDFVHPVRKRNKVIHKQIRLDAPRLSLESAGKFGSDDGIAKEASVKQMNTESVKGYTETARLLSTGTSDSVFNEKASSNESGIVQVVLNRDVPPDKVSFVASHPVSSRISLPAAQTDRGDTNCQSSAGKTQNEKCPVCDALIGPTENITKHLADCHNLIYSSATSSTPTSSSVHFGAGSESQQLGGTSSSGSMKLVEHSGARRSTQASCLDCHTLFSSRLMLSQHKRICPKQSSSHYLCAICITVFTDRRLYHEHVLTSHSTASSSGFNAGVSDGNSESVSSSFGKGTADTVESRSTVAESQSSADAVVQCGGDGAGNKPKVVPVCPRSGTPNSDVAESGRSDSSGITKVRNSSTHAVETSGSMVDQNDACKSELCESAGCSDEARPEQSTTTGTVVDAEGSRIELGHVDSSASRLRNDGSCDSNTEDNVLNRSAVTCKDQVGAISREMEGHATAGRSVSRVDGPEQQSKEVNKINEPQQIVAVDDLESVVKTESDGEQMLSSNDAISTAIKIEPDVADVPVPIQTLVAALTVNTTLRCPTAAEICVGKVRTVDIAAQASTATAAADPLPKLLMDTKLLHDIYKRNGCRRLRLQTSLVPGSDIMFVGTDDQETTIKVEDADSRSTNDVGGMRRNVESSSQGGKVSSRGSMDGTSCNDRLKDLRLVSCSASTSSIRSDHTGSTLGSVAEESECESWTDQQSFLLNALSLVPRGATESLLQNSLHTDKVAAKKTGLFLQPSVVDNVALSRRSEPLIRTRSSQRMNEIESAQSPKNSRYAAQPSKILSRSINQPASKLNKSRDVAGIVLKRLQRSPAKSSAINDSATAIGRRHGIDLVAKGVPGGHHAVNREFTNLLNKPDAGSSRSDSTVRQCESGGQRSGKRSIRIVEPVDDDTLKCVQCGCLLRTVQDVVRHLCDN